MGKMLGRWSQQPASAPSCVTSAPWASRPSSENVHHDPVMLGHSSLLRESLKINQRGTMHVSPDHTYLLSLWGGTRD